MFYFLIGIVPNQYPFTLFYKWFSTSWQPFVNSNPSINLSRPRLCLLNLYVTMGQFSGNVRLTVQSFTGHR
jgi:hypothetical protein